MSDIAAKVVVQSPDRFIQKAMKVYGLKTIEDRAIPDLRDGLKPVQRRILWAMKNLGNAEQFRKSARIVGETMGNYHPHGDLAIYGALVTMANFSTPFVDGGGNWGNPATGDNAASMRYTECRLSEFSVKYLLDPEYLEVTELAPNYDNTLKEPVVLPALVPTIFFSAAQGIAVGVSTTFPAFTEKFIKTATKKFLSGVKPTAKWLAKNVEFEYRGGGNCITPTEDIEKLFTEGVCSVEFEVDYNVDANKRQLFINSNAAAMNIEQKIKQVQDLQTVRSVMNETTDDIRYIIEFKPSVNTKEVNELAEQIVKKYFTKRVKYSTAITVRELTKDGDETTADFAELPVIDIFKDWAEWRIDLEVRMLQHRLAKLETKVRNERVLLRASKQVVALAKLISKKDNVPLTERVAKLLKIKKEEAELVLSRTLRSLSAMEQSTVRKTIQKLTQDIVDTKASLNNPEESCIKKLAALG